MDAVGFLVGDVELVPPPPLLDEVADLLEGDAVPKDSFEYKHAAVLVGSAVLAEAEKDEDVPAVVVPEQAVRVPRPDPDPQPRRHAGVKG